MSKLAYLSIFFLLLTAMAIGQTPEPQPTRTQCERWRNQHQRYSDLRRTGGTLAQMDRWRDRQRSIEARMREAKCKQRFRISY